MFVKLRDKGGMFHDASQDFTLSGGFTVGECNRTGKVQSAMKGGVIEELRDEKEFKAAMAERGQTDVSEVAWRQRLADEAAEAAKPQAAAPVVVAPPAAKPYDKWVKAELLAEVEKREDITEDQIKEADTNPKLVALLEADDLNKK